MVTRRALPMKKSAWMAVLASLMAVLSLALPATSGAASCANVTVEVAGDESGAFHIRTDGVSCRTARRLVREYLETGHAPAGWDVRNKPRAFVLERGIRKIAFKVAS
jgi:hypothetical protein